MQKIEVSNNILTFMEYAPEEIVLDVAARVRARRLEKNLTQRALAARAGMSLASYRRFERTGDISFRKLVMLAIVLNAEESISHLFVDRRYANIDEVIAAASGAPKRKRGRHDS